MTLQYRSKPNPIIIGLGTVCLFALIVLLLERASSVYDVSSIILPSSLSSSSNSNQALPTTAAQEQWHFESKRDELNYGLSDEQCQQAFPGLYQEVDRAVKLRKPRKRIQKKDLRFCLPKTDEGGRKGNHTQIHVLIHSGQLRVLGFHRGWQRLVRPKSTLSSIHRAMNGIDPRTLPNVEFLIDVEDIGFHDGCPERPAWVYCRLADASQKSVWVMPDYDGWSYKDPSAGSYMAFREKVLSLEETYAEKKEQLVWRGNINIAKNIRQSLLEHAKNKPWADVAPVNWYTRENVIAMEDFCRYRFNAYTEGVSWSGRLRYLQNCHTAIFVHPFKWIAHYFPLLEANKTGPGQTYIPIKRDYSDIEAKMNYFLDTPEGRRRAKRIADNSVKTFRERYLTPAAEACYWRRMIKGYAEIQAFEPELWMTKEDGKPDFRGVSFEHWLTRDEDDPSVPQQIDDGGTDEESEKNDEDIY